MNIDNPESAQGDMPEPAIILNPAAGEGLARKRWNRFSRRLVMGGIKFSLHTTVARGHATQLAADLIMSGHRRLVVFGGDGTLNETVQGVFSNGPPPDDLFVTYLGAGSSCDFERSFPKCRDWLDRIVTPTRSAIDVCKVSCNDGTGGSIERYFVNNSSVGIISAANVFFSDAGPLLKNMKRLSVDLAAIGAGIRAIAAHRAHKCRIKIDGAGFEDRILSNLTVFKTPYFGGGMNYGVETALDDGYLNVALLDGTSRLRLVSLMPSLYTGHIFRRKGTQYLRCHTFEIDGPTEAIIETDGENIGHLPARYELLPTRLRVLM